MTDKTTTGGSNSGGSKAGEANDADRERHAREQDQALGHHADHAGDRGDERVADRLSGLAQL